VKRVSRDETDSVKTLVQVPKDEVVAATQMSWRDLLKHAHAVGWVVRDSADFSWCAKGHTLLREGREELEGLPVLLYER
jgi:hypothetical protein